MKIYLIRHTPTIAPQGLCYGQTDLPIKEPYLHHFENIKKHIDIDKFEIYSSPLTRCLQLANHLKNQQSIITSKNLMEVNFGDWENQPWSKIPVEVINTWMKDFVNVAPPNGESFIQLYQRIIEFIETELLIKENNTPKVIVTHGGVIRCFLCYVLEIPLHNAFKIQIDYSSVTKIYLNEKQ